MLQYTSSGSVLVSSVLAAAAEATGVAPAAASGGGQLEALWPVKADGAALEAPRVSVSGAARRATLAPREAKATELGDLTSLRASIFDVEG